MGETIPQVFVFPLLFLLIRRSSSSIMHYAGVVHGSGRLLSCASLLVLTRNQDAMLRLSLGIGVLSIITIFKFARPSKSCGREKQKT